MKGKPPIYIEKVNEPTPVITIGLNLNDPHFDYSMQELNALAQANDMDVKATESQTIDHPFAGTYFGPGKAAALRDLALQDQVKTIISNDELTPSQIRNLEKITGCNIIDRTGLILEIFAHRARTKEAKLQIRLAQLKYQLPRLRTSASIRLDQQTGTGGGSYTNRGSGETLIEMERRTVMHRIYNLRHHLKAVAKTKATQTQRRQDNFLPNIALVGYTNAGKSTLMNAFLKRFSAQHGKLVGEKNMLFATLSTKVRKIQLPEHRDFMLSDTVGFVSKLPHELIKAFQSTLSEAAHADLLLQVVDASATQRQLMMQTTQDTLERIGIKNIPMITILNKADQTDMPYPEQTGNTIVMSAKDPKSLDALVKMINNFLQARYVTQTYLIPYQDGRVVEEFNQKAHVIQTKYQANGTLIKVSLPKVMAPRYQKYLNK